MFAGRILGTDHAGGGHAIHDRHFDIEQNDIVVGVAGAFDGTFAVFHGIYVKAQALQECCRDSARGFLILGIEHPLCCAPARPGEALWWFAPRAMDFPMLKLWRNYAGPGIR